MATYCLVIRNIYVTVLWFSLLKVRLGRRTITGNPEYQWRIQNLSDAGIPVCAPKPGAQIKWELMQKNISHLMISSTQMRLHVLRHLTLVKNVKLKTLCMPGSTTQVCLNVSRCIVCINESNISVATVCPNEALDMALNTWLLLLLLLLLLLSHIKQILCYWRNQCETITCSATVIPHTTTLMDALIC